MSTVSFHHFGKFIKQENFRLFPKQELSAGQWSTNLYLWDTDGAAQVSGSLSIFKDRRGWRWACKLPTSVVLCMFLYRLSARSHYGETITSFKITWYFSRNSRRLNSKWAETGTKCVLLIRTGAPHWRDESRDNAIRKYGNEKSWLVIRTSNIIPSTSSVAFFKLLLNIHLCFSQLRNFKKVIFLCVKWEGKFQWYRVWKDSRSDT